MTKGFDRWSKNIRDEKSVEIYTKKGRNISKEDMDITFAPHMRKLILKTFVEKYIICNAKVTANSNKKEAKGKSAHPAKFGRICLWVVATLFVKIDKRIC